MTATGDSLSTSAGRPQDGPSRTKEVTAGDSQVRNFSEETQDEDKRVLAIPGGARLVGLLLTVTEQDAQTFIADWDYDRNGPILTGGFQENPVYVFQAEIRG